jgi:hypothetical protein
MSKCTISEVIFSRRRKNKEMVGEVVGWGVEDRLDWLMKGGSMKTRMKVMKGMTRWMYERERRWEEERSLRKRRLK